MDRIVVAGASNAGVTVARELRRQGFAGSLALVDAETRGPYRRPEVSKGLLGGTLTAEEIGIPWPRDLDLDLVLGARIESVDLDSRRLSVCDRDGTSTDLAYDGLAITVGCEARPSPFGDGIGGVHSLRSLDDSIAMKRDLDRASRVVIIGGGFIGLEVASVARKLGKSVTVIEIAEIPLAHIVGPGFGSRLLRLHRDRGVEFRLGTGVERLLADADGAVDAVLLSTGERVEADVVLVAVGSRPAVTWLEESGVPVSNGVECDETCAVVGIDGMVAAGDAASWINPLYGRRMRVEHWTNAIEQGVYAARRLLGKHDSTGFVSAPYFWSDQHDSKIQSIGSSAGYDEIITLEDTENSLLVAYGQNGRLISVAGINAGTAIMQKRSAVLDRVALATL